VEKIEVYDIMGLQHTSFGTTDRKMIYSLFLILLYSSNTTDRKTIMMEAG
jgi:hypothetical protein